MKPFFFFTTVAVIVLALAAASDAAAGTQNMAMTLSFAYDAVCKRGLHKAVEFNSGACASWKPGTSQVMLCAPTAAPQLCFQATQFNRSQPGGSTCSNEAASGFPIPCDQCIPQSLNNVPTGKYFAVRQCNNPSQMYVDMDCPTSDCDSTKCGRKIPISFKTCQIFDEKDNFAYTFTAPQSCRPSIKILSWNNSETCSGTPTETQTQFEGMCYGSGTAPPTSSSFTCGPDSMPSMTHSHHQHRAPPRLSSSSSSSSLPGVRIYQCSNRLCNGKTPCTWVAKYFDNACISYGNSPAMTFQCVASQQSDRSCVSIATFNKSKAGAQTCAIDAIAYTFNQKCGVENCQNSTNGTYSFWGNCSESGQQFGLNAACDAGCKNCKVFLPLEPNHCDHPGGDTTQPGMYFGHAGSCPKDVKITQYLSDSCVGGDVNQTYQFPVGAGFCLGQQPGDHVGVQYFCEN